MEAEHAEALASAIGTNDAAAVEHPSCSPARLQELSDALRASEARAEAAERDAEAQAVARAAAEERATTASAAAAAALADVAAATADAAASAGTAVAAGASEASGVGHDGVDGDAAAVAEVAVEEASKEILRLKKARREERVELEAMLRASRYDLIAACFPSVNICGY